MFRIHIIVLLFSSSMLFPQNAEPKLKKIVEAKRVEGKIEIDGILNEIDWQSAVVADSFVTFNPVPGLKATEDG